MAIRITFPIKIEIPKIEEDVYCYKLKLFKQTPYSLYTPVGVWFYVDNEGNIMIGGFNDIEQKNCIWGIDKYGNVVDTYCSDIYTEILWRPYKYPNGFGVNVGYTNVSAGSYTVTLSDTGFHVFRHGKRIWYWSLYYDNIKDKAIFYVAISTNGKYIAFATGATEGYSVDSIVLYEGCSNRSLCPPIPPIIPSAGYQPPA